MNRWNGTAYLTYDPELHMSKAGSEICVLRVGVKRAAREGDGYFTVKVFGDLGAACAEHLKAGREVAIDGKLFFESWRTKDDEPRSRLIVIADWVEFLNSRPRRDNSRDDSGQEPDPEGAETAACRVRRYQP